MAGDDYSAANPQDLSMFNMGIATLTRIHQLLEEVHKCSLGISNSADVHSPQQAVQQLKTLDRVYAEIRAYLKEPERIKVLQQRDKLNSVFGNDPKKYGDSYQDLLDYENLMRDTKYLSNMLMPKGDDPTVAMRG